MKVSKVKVFSAVLAVMLLATLALAQSVQRTHMHGDGMMGGGPMLPFFSDALDLSDAQRAQIKEIFHNGHSAVHPLMQQEMQHHQAMMQLITGGNFDQAKAQAIATEGAQIHAQIEVQHALLASQAYQVLTPDQKTKMNELMAKHEQEFQEHMQKHGPPDAEPNQ